MTAAKETGWLLIVHWLAVLIATAGSVLVSFKLPAAGCGLWVVANALWLVWTIKRRDLPTTVLFLVYEVIAVVGVINWTTGS